ADLAVALLDAEPRAVVGVDISDGMLELGRKKVAKKKLSDQITLVQGDAAALPFDDDTFDGATVAFGVRNFEDLRAGLAGMRRVLRPGAPLVVLEFSHPQAFPVKQAYEYLPESVAQFPDGQAFVDEMRAVGFTQCTAKPLTFGIVTLYRGRA
ncbi:MAG TPA: methyltransferase domain-containing protein, partial [Rhodothermales bacterium]|nr:methyltransferase domain-containing protein [Rhodothermales bacterium]